MSCISLCPPLCSIRIRCYTEHLQPAYTTTLAVQCKRKQMEIPENIILGHLRPMREEDSQVYDEAADNTATVLADSWTMNTVTFYYRPDFHSHFLDTNMEDL